MLMNKFVIDSKWITPLGLQLRVTNVEQSPRCLAVITFCTINGEDITFKRRTDECNDLTALPS